MTTPFHIRFILSGTIGRTSSQSSAYAKAPEPWRTPFAASGCSSTSTFVVNLHGIIAAETHGPLAARLLVVCLHRCFEGPLLLATHLFPVYGLLLDSLNLLFKIREGRIAAL
jgi:hypothetical protein